MMKNLKNLNFVKKINLQKYIKIKVWSNPNYKMFLRNQITQITLRFTNLADSGIKYNLWPSTKAILPSVKKIVR